MPLTSQDLAEALLQIPAAPDPLQNIYRRISRPDRKIDMLLLHRHRREVQQAIQQANAELSDVKNLRGMIEYNL